MPKLPDSCAADGPREESFHAVARALDANFAARPAGGGRVRILEAGCGQRWVLKNLLHFPYELTGVDLDREALALRHSMQDDLDKTVYGDLRTVDFPDAAFDVIYCAFVLEHIRGAGNILRKFRNWISPGGIIVITVPDRTSGFGLITRVTPHWFHVFYYRYVQGIKSAGKPGHAPYPTYYDQEIAPQALRDFAAASGLEVVAELRARDLPRQGMAKYVIDTALFVVELLSLGRFTSAHNNLTVLFRKRPA